MYIIYFIYIIGFTQENYNSCGHLILWNAWITRCSRTNILHVRALTCQTLLFLLKQAGFKLSKQMRCSPWEAMTPLDKALGEHTNHSNPTSGTCASLSPGVKKSALGHNKSWVLWECVGRLEEAFLALGMGELLPKGRKVFGNWLMAWMWGFPVVFSRPWMWDIYKASKVCPSETCDPLSFKSTPNTLTSQHKQF